MKTKNKLTFSIVGLLVAAAGSMYACTGAEDPSELEDKTTGTGQTDIQTTTSNGSGGASSSSSGSEGGINFTNQGGNGGSGGSCADIVAEANIIYKPADIIFVIDNSGSMNGEIAGVEQNINQNFAQIIGASSIDYRIIMLTDHGAGSLDVCIEAPLSTIPIGGCNSIGSNPPGTNAGLFYHYSKDVYSHDSLCIVLDTLYGNKPDEFSQAPMGWSQWLRPEAVKVFVELSDDGVSCTSTTNSNNYNDSDNINAGKQVAVDFDKDLLAASPLHFGTAASRNYLWYSIVGLQAKYLNNNPQFPAAMKGDPWESFEDVTSEKCTPGSVSPATAYQWLSKGTGALRFPLCDPTGYNVVFNDIAAGVVSGATVPCEFELPDPPPGQMLDLDTISVLYKPTNGPTEEFLQVKTAQECGLAADKFYIDGDLIKLCPKACEKVTADEGAKIDIKINCGGPPT